MAAAGHRKRVTEEQNAITKNIDLASPQGIVRLLGQVDEQIFVGWGANHVAMVEDVTIEAIDRLAARMCNVLRKGGSIVFSGCGTSGRLAFVCARTFNRTWKQYLTSRTSGCGTPNKAVAAVDSSSSNVNNSDESKASSPFVYCLAGGDAALVKSQESMEDNAIAGARDLQTKLDAVTDQELSVVVGITCGLSAPYVAGQLVHALKDSRISPCLLGFNPVELARNVAIEHFPHTFRQVVELLRKQQQACKDTDHHRPVILNPVLGPEAITGSTRMKGGSGTKILLEVAFLRAVYMYDQATRPSTSKSSAGYPSVADLLGDFHSTCVQTYALEAHIAPLIAAGGHSLRNKGHVYYVGGDTLGLLAFVDASEQPPTFGASFEDIRGFEVGGWEAFANDQGDLSSKGPEYHISAAHFRTHIVPTLSAADSVVLIFSDDLTDNHKSILVDVLTELPTELHHCSIVHVDGSASQSSHLNKLRSAFSVRSDTANKSWLTLPAPALQDTVGVSRAPFLQEFAVKLVLNALSTGAHVLKGQVFHNLMINVKLSNNKLFYRAVGIVIKVATVPWSSALHAVLRSVYGDNQDVESFMNTAQPDDSGVGFSIAPELVAKHVECASKRTAVVPVAVLLALDGKHLGKGDSPMLVKSAVELVAAQPIVRRVILHQLKK